MTEPEFWVAIGLIRLLWDKPDQQVGDATAEAWWKIGLFADLDAADVEAAIVALRATKPWPADPAEIRGWIAQHEDAAHEALWSAVWSELLAERDRVGPWSEAPWSAAVGPFVAYVGAHSLVGLSRGSEVPLEVLHGQLRRQWEAWRDSQVECHTVEQLPAVRAFRERRGLPLLPAGHEDLESGIVHLAERKRLNRKARTGLPPAVE